MFITPINLMLIIGGYNHMKGISTIVKLPKGGLPGGGLPTGGVSKVVSKGGGKAVMMIGGLGLLLSLY